MPHNQVQSSLYLLFMDIIHQPSFSSFKHEKQFDKNQQIQCMLFYLDKNHCLEYLIKDVWKIVFEFLVYVKIDKAEYGIIDKEEYYDYD